MIDDMHFTKMHGIGNDYVYVDGFKHHLTDPAAVARAVSNRHFGIGSDGLILVLPSDHADVRMRMFNADGSEAEMCGNGIRCVAKFAFDHGLSKSNPMRVETGRGVLSLDLDVRAGRVERVTVDMGPPILKLADVPVDAARVVAVKAHVYELRVGDQAMAATFVSTGNPHAVVFVDDVAAVDLPKIGPAIEHHAAFPRRINGHFVQVIGRGEVIMRTWERGSGITLACGTGACAVAVAGVLTGRTDGTILAHLPGGDLTLKWPGGESNVLMTGPATEVFTGEWSG